MNLKESAQSVVKKLEQIREDMPNLSNEDLDFIYESISNTPIMELGSELQAARDRVKSVSEQLILHSLYVILLKNHLLPHTINKWREEIVHSFLLKVVRVANDTHFTQEKYFEYLYRSVDDRLAHRFEYALNKKGLGSGSGSGKYTCGTVESALPQLKEFIWAVSGLLAGDPSVPDLEQAVKRL